MIYNIFVQPIVQYCLCVCVLLSLLEREGERGTERIRERRESGRKRKIILPFTSLLPGSLWWFLAGPGIKPVMGNWIQASQVVVGTSCLKCHFCVLGSVAAVSWHQELELGIEPRYFDIRYGAQEWVFGLAMTTPLFFPLLKMTACCKLNWVFQSPKVTVSYDHFSFWKFHPVF